MDGKGIKIKFEADESPVRSSLVKVEKSLKTLTKDLKEVDKLLELDPNNITLLQTKQEQLNTAVETTTKNLKAMESANDDITKGFEKWKQNQASIQEYQEKIAAVEASLEQATTQLKEFNAKKLNGDTIPEDDYNRAKKAVDDLKKSLEQLEKQKAEVSAADKNALPQDVYQKYIRDTESLRINLKQLEQQQTEVASAIQAGGLAAQRAAQEEQERLRIEQESAAAEEEKRRAAEEAARAAEEEAQAEAERKRVTQQAAEADKQAKTAADNYKTSLNKLEQAAEKVKNDIHEMTTIVATGTGAIAGAVAAGTVEVSKVGMDFTKAMSNVEALSGATQDQLDSLTEAAAQAGANTSKTATEAASALGYMSLAGWDTNQMLEGLMPVLRASEAGAMDLANCSDLVTDSMSAMGIAVEDLQHYLDVCTKTQSSSNTSLQQLLEAYVVCGGTLKNLNVPLETSATLLGTLANRGIKGAEAGTALNSILVNLIGANKNAASAMDTLDASAFDAEGHFIGLDETLKLVKSRLDEYGDDTERITQLEAKLGGKTQLDTLQALLSGVSEEYDDLNGKITDCNGALESTAKTMQDNLSGDMTALTSSLEGVENTIFNSLEEPFRSAAQHVTQDIRNLNTECSEGELADAISRIAASVSEFISKAADFATEKGFPAIIEWLDWIAQHSDAIISAIKGMGAAWATWKVLQFASHLQELVQAIQLVQSASVAATAAQTGLNTSAATAAASEEALAAATKLTAEAQMVAYAAIIALTVALASYIAKQIDAAAENLKQRNAIDDTTQAIFDQTAAYNKSVDAARKNMDEADKNADATARYWQEVQNLVDENGRATGSTQDLETAVARLNEVSGANIQVVNGQIQGYKDLSASFDDYIEDMRRNAKIGALQQSYGEALLNYDQEAYDQAWNDMQKATTEYDRLKKLENQAIAQGSTAGLAWEGSFLELAEATDAAEKEASRASTAYSAISQQMEGYKSVIDEYEGLVNSTTEAEEELTDSIKSTAQLNAEEVGKKVEESYKAAANGTSKGLDELNNTLLETLNTKMDELDHRKAVHGIGDEEYWTERQKLLEKYRLEESEDWWKYYEQNQEYFDEQTTAQKNAYEKQIEDQVDALKERKETDLEMTDEMFYSEFESIISALDHESDLYKKYNSEILKGRQKLADETVKATKDGLKKSVTDTETALKEEVSSYQNSLKSLTSARDKLFNKLWNTSSFVKKSTQTDANGKSADVTSLADPAEALKKLNEFEKAQNRLAAKGASQNVLDWIETLDDETAKDTMDILNKMSESQFSQYVKNFDAYKNKAMEMADSKYQPKIDELNQSFISKVDALIGELPGKAQVSGQDTVAGYIAGIKNKESDLSAAATEFCNTYIEQVKKDLDIHSPSGKAEDMGENTGEGMIKGLEKISLADAADSMTDDFIAKLASKDPEIRAAMEATFTDNMADVLSNMSSLTYEQLNQIASDINKKLPTLPDAALLTLPNSAAVSSESNAPVIEELDRLNDKLDVLIELFKAALTSGSEQSIKLQLELTGELSADMNKITAILAKKFNNISVQTGKRVFSY